jgi:hypothetical protein
MPVREHSGSSSGPSLHRPDIKVLPWPRYRDEREGAIASLVEAIVKQAEAPLGGRPGKVEGIREQGADLGCAGAA